ncbi:outer membrane protein, OMP85 family protein [Pseudooceanicola batsensis HTCC2597]|uniref:Outer membrane protein assembly factor BamA n=1 Tax=Pseudooceanicola batsensis (strain ATCC BAA-863 / DSM 15984 / KCTC 12145 / HTCC2597) TaxID=252305 RepID=A3TWV2_PSEBH|nr:outer membrane protein assembly factor BamA [Pseudooceanicola batsensis]EAQ03312.1 outer membrane protein, OMP85 family protein [Pseudooceanicola batsensis HTCC2597]
MKKTKQNRAANLSLKKPMSRVLIAALLFSTAVPSLPEMAFAQSYRFNSVQVDGNARIETGTVLSYAGIARGETISAAELNDAYQRLVASGLFETVEIVPRGGTLVINVVEYPTVNRVTFEGNRRLDDEALASVVQSKPRLVFSPTRAESDAARIAEAYSQEGRISARVTPRIIRRSDNRVDLVYEVFEGRNTEINRIGFVGNRVYSDRRLRRVLETKQAGLLRQLIRRDTFQEDRLQFDQQVLRDFYLSRGYIDFRTTAVDAELARERDAYFVTFNVQEGQQFRFGDITVVSNYPAADAEAYEQVVRLRPGIVYSPNHVENAIARMENLAVREGLDFLRVEPRITRNERDLTLDVEFVLSRGPRVFVERIDVEGNTTTLDRVVRRQFRIVEGDPFNPRQIREAAERIRALNFFENTQVNAREGSSPDRVVVDVDVEEKATGSLSFGGTYSTNSGFGLAISFSETNFLGRGQSLFLSLAGADSNKNYSLAFVEPAFLGRDVAFSFDLGVTETESFNAPYDTEVGEFGLGLEFPLAERSRLGLTFSLESSEMKASTSGDAAGSIIQNEIGQGDVISSSIGYKYTFDSRENGFDPTRGFLFEFGQDYAGLGGDVQFIETKARAVAQARILNEEVTVRASLRGGMLNYTKGSSRTIDRVNLLGDYLRGFEPSGVGPRQRGTNSSGAAFDNALAGNMFVVGSVEAEFPLGLPEEYGITGGAFYDISNIWDVGASAGQPGVLYNNGSYRHVVGLSVFWDTPIGPLRFNFAKALKKEQFDQEQFFNVTIRSEF